MTSESRPDAVELEQPEHPEDAVVVKRDGVLRAVLRGLYWPFGLALRTYRGFCWVLGFRRPAARVILSPAGRSPARHSLCGRKRLHRVTRLLLSVVPRCVQSALGYPVSSSIGRCLSPEIRVSPTKPSGKGSKRKQDELDEDEEDEESQTWVEALNQQYSEDEGPEEDPDFEPSTVETESEEYCSHNNTESDVEVDGTGVVIKDLDTGLEPSSPSEASCLPV
ncbi:oogenesis-related [Pseudoliparis swirei]|uniref:oogenesis-related n=1 Tax=Pseudoliparis swirei TaxID=2059687 RepID=UPI0024BE7B92|nr:oogenesis-related [Pseudoliparis swirei]XP_056270910.1 oogenesis-related [Pseudoliparis swirei]